MKKIIAIILILLPLNLTLAQNDDVSVKVSPVLPEAGERVYVSLESFSVNLSDSNISWFSKKQIIKQGEGVTSINFIVPQESVDLVIQIITPEAQEIVKNITISGNSNDLLWEAPDTYTPPFYKGKALPGPESLVKFVSLPSSLNNFNLTKNADFVWSRNGSIIGPSSGKGRDSYSILMDSTKDVEKISVTTNYLNQRSNNEVSFKPFNMSVSVYPLSSGGEPFIARSLRNGDVVNKEVSFFAAPYGAHPKYLSSRGLTYSWKIGSESITPTSRPFLITVSPNNQSDQNVYVGYEMAKSLFDGISRVFQIKI